MESTVVVPAFAFGRVVATPGALALLLSTGHTPHEYLDRHVQGYWGDVGEDDWKANEEALKTGERLLSAYNIPEAEGGRDLDHYRVGSLVYDGFCCLKSIKGSLFNARFL